MNPPLFDASVPVFLHYLHQLDGLVRKAAAHTAQRALPAEAILQARLAPDMLPFCQQVEIAANFALRACAPLANLPLPPYGPACTSFAALHARIAATRDFVAALTPAQMADAASRVLTSQAGNAEVALPGPAFLSCYALPNFFFHLTSAYAILRHVGVAVGKADFDGFHQYPPPDATR
jgi:hypothetical protein